MAQVKGMDSSTKVVTNPTTRTSSASPTSNSKAISSSTGDASQYLRGTTSANTSNVVTNPSGKSGGSSGSSSGSTGTTIVPSTSTSNVVTNPTTSNSNYSDSRFDELYDLFSQQSAQYTTLVNNLSAKLANSEASLQKITDAYNTALEQQKAAIQAGVDQSVNTITNQKSDVETNYANTARQLYLDKMNAQKNIGQQMAAAGQTGGQAESTLLGLNTNYADALRQSEQAKTTTLSDLETAIANAKLSASAEEANAIANNATNSVNAYNTQLNTLNSQGLDLASLVNSAANSTFNNGLNYANYTSSQDQQNYSNAYSKAMTWLQNGIMPDSDTLTNAGISQAEANALIASINASKTSGGSGSGSGGGSSSSSSTMTKAQADKYLEALGYEGTGLTLDDATAAEIEKVYGMPIEWVLGSKGISSKVLKRNQSSSQQAGTAGTSNTDSGSYIKTISATGKQTDAVGSTAYENRASNYATVKEEAEKKYKTQGKDAALDFISLMYNGDETTGYKQYINYTDYMSLYNKYRDAK